MNKSKIILILAGCLLGLVIVYEIAWINCKKTMLKERHLEVTSVLFNTLKEGESSPQNMKQLLAEKGLFHLKEHKESTNGIYLFVGGSHIANNGLDDGDLDVIYKYLSSIKDAK